MPILLSSFNIPLLGGFGAASEKDYNLESLLAKINAITGSMIDAQFENAVAKRLPVSWISQTHPSDPCQLD
ncbi:MAG: hypothetical protein L0Z50_26090 [Verrucomicrobiales bacterium]|nr:hypothetical protein [Verrucomicrobiales bacterium]